MGESAPLLREPEAPLLPFDGVVISREGPTRTTSYKSAAGFVFDTKRQKRERESQALQVVVFLSPYPPTCSFCNQGCKISGMPKRTCRERLTPPSLFQLNSSVARCERKREVFFHPPVSQEDEGDSVCAVQYKPRRLLPCLGSWNAKKRRRRRSSIENSSKQQRRNVF